MANGDPILVLSYKRDTWIWDFSFGILAYVTILWWEF